MEEEKKEFRNDIQMYLDLKQEFDDYKKETEVVYSENKIFCKTLGKLRSETLKKASKLIEEIDKCSQNFPIVTFTPSQDVRQVLKDFKKDDNLDKALKLLTCPFNRNIEVNLDTKIKGEIISKYKAKLDEEKYYSIKALNLEVEELKEINENLESQVDNINKDLGICKIEVADMASLNRNQADSLDSTRLRLESLATSNEITKKELLLSISVNETLKKEVSSTNKECKKKINFLKTIVIVFIVTVLSIMAFHI